MQNEYFFETIRCEDYEFFHLEYHQKRMAKAVGFNFNLPDYLYAPSSSLLKCKIIYNEEGIIDVQFAPYKKRDIKSFKLVVDDRIEYSKKALNRELLDKLFAQKGEADEIIIIKNGLVTDTSIANLAIHDGSNWITPKKPLLEGTTRARLLQNKEIFEKDITVEMLQGAKKIALLNAMIDFDIVEDYCLCL